MIIYATVVLLLLIGLYGVISRRDMIKMVMALEIIESAINLFIVSLGYKQGAVTAIFTNAPTLSMNLPTPQALTLTSIVIGVAISALMLALTITVYKHYGTKDIQYAGRLKG